MNSHNVTFQSYNKQVASTFTCLMFVRLIIPHSLTVMLTLLPVAFYVRLPSGWEFIYMSFLRDEDRIVEVSNS